MPHRRAPDGSFTNHRSQGGELKIRAAQPPHLKKIVRLGTVATRALLDNVVREDVEESVRSVSIEERAWEDTMLPLDHVGIAVSNLDAALEEHRKHFGFQLDSREVVESQKVEIAFIRLPNTLIELLAPTDDTSPLARFLAKRGPGLHHLCYRVDDIVAELDRLAASGVELIDRAPRSGAHGTRIAFLHPRSMGGVLVELCEHPRSAPTPAAR